MSRLQPHKTYPPIPETAGELRAEAYEAIQESEDCNNPEHAIAAALRGLALATLAEDAPYFEVKEAMDHVGRS